MTARLDDVRGLWRRTLFRRGNDAPDCSAEVFWLQGPHFFADIRQPVERMSFAGVTCLRDLNADHLAWLASQQAFAGRLELDGTLAWWRRSIDLQPEGPFADRARLEQTGGVLDEYGIEASYTERWERENSPLDPCWGMRLASLTDGREGFLVRAGGRLMFGRARTSSLPSAQDLARILAPLPLERKQDLLDFEVSLGRMQPATSGQHGEEWLIERSTLPYKQGRAWSLQLHTGAPEDPLGVVELADLDREGNPIVGRWRIAETDHPEAARELDRRTRHSA